MSRFDVAPQKTHDARSHPEASTVSSSDQDMMTNECDARGGRRA